MSRTFIISRTDSIGDVMLTLPVAGVLRELYPDARILFLGNSYTEEIVRACVHIDEFIDWNEWKALGPADRAERLSAVKADTIIHVFPDREIAMMARDAGIPKRIGTTHRWFHWTTCNVLVNLGRKNSPYHEAQLNLKLLAVLGARSLYTPDEIAGLYGFTRLSPLPDELLSLPDPGRFNLIIHPRSRGSAREWGLNNFSELITQLPSDQFKLFITGTAADRKGLDVLFREHPAVTDLTGKLDLGQLISFISRVDGLLAASTGPLHIAAALGIHALGLFSPMRPIHPGRWAPIGKKVKVFVKDGKCEACRISQDCACLRDISPVSVKEYLLFVNLEHQLKR